MTQLWRYLLPLIGLVCASVSAPAASQIIASSNGTVNGRHFPSLMEADLEQLAAGLASRQFTSVDLVKTYAARIKEVNGTLHVVTELNPDAISIAAQLDQERKAGKLRGPLHGIPLLIKNNIATSDKMSTSAGSYALINARPPRDATVASKLRAAGAILLGKSNLSQWANFRSLNSSNGWSAYGGQCFAAYYPEQDPGGSSSGSGVATDLGLALAALGTETSGSVISPSENNNIVGIKPTVGLTSRALVVPISQRQDTVGPMAKYVKDAAYLLQAIAGVDPADNYTLASPYSTGKLPDYVASCVKTALKGKRIGVPRNLISEETGDGPVLSAFETSIQTLKALGAIVVDNTNVTSWSANYTFNSPDPTTVLEADFVSDLPGEYLSKLATNPNNVTSLAQARAFTQQFPLEDWPSRDTILWDQALALGFDNTSPQFWPLYQNNLEAAGRQGILGVLKNHSLDALILPSDFSYVQPAFVGTPIVTVPLGFYPGDTPVAKSPPRNNLVGQAPNIPFGLSFMGPAWSEPQLISFAYAYEQKTQTRNKVKPYITPMTELWNVVGS